MAVTLPEYALLVKLFYGNKRNAAAYFPTSGGKKKVWFGLERYGLFFATRGLIRPGPSS